MSARRAHCTACGATRRDVTLWRQIVALHPTAVCCWPGPGVVPTR